MVHAHPRALSLPACIRTRSPLAHWSRRRPVRPRRHRGHRRSRPRSGAFAVPMRAADNTLVSSTPAAGSTVDASPASLEMKFVGPGCDQLVQVVCTGSPIAVGTPAVGVDGMSLTVAVPSPLPKGECAVVAGHPARRAERWQRDVPLHHRHDTVATVAPLVTTAPPARHRGTATTTAPATATESRRHGDRIRIRRSTGPVATAISLGVAVLFGSFVLIAMAWPEGVEYILTVRFLRITLLLRGRHLQRGVHASQVTGKGFGGSLSPLVEAPHRHRPRHRRAVPPVSCS